MTTQVPEGLNYTAFEICDDQSQIMIERLRSHRSSGQLINTALIIGSYFTISEIRLASYHLGLTDSTNRIAQAIRIADYFNRVFYVGDTQ